MQSINASASALKQRRTDEGKAAYGLPTDSKMHLLNSEHTSAAGTSHHEKQREPQASEQSKHANVINRQKTTNNTAYTPEEQTAITTATQDQELQPVRALVSSSAVLSADMLVKSVLLAGELTSAHLDTCATHCFVSERMSKILNNRGYPPWQSKVTYAVEQGNPLCTTSRVHILHLIMATQSGGQARWEAVLFIVADCGADVIICYPVLRQGGIVDYDPPANYISLLQDCASECPKAAEARELAQRAIREGSMYMYGPPDSGENNCESLVNKLTRMEPLNGLKHTQEGSKILRTETFTPPSSSSAHKPTGKPNSKLKPPPLAALTESEPFGKNPPLPSEVMEALTLLKNLSENDSVVYTASQLQEVQEKLKDKRPQWSRGLTLQHMEEVSDKDTERFINDLMDKPRWQNSIFQTSMHLDTTCDFKEFEIPQKPGVDMWNPPQPRLYRNPTTAKITEDWLDILYSNKKCRESIASHPASVTVVIRPPRDPRVCIDYRNRNHRSEIPIYPMPDVHDFLEEAVGYDHYCSFDMAKMFTQFRIKEEDKHLAAFITPRGVFEPNVVMFGLAGAPQHAVREVGGGMAKDPRTNGTAFTEWAKEQNAKGEMPPYEICPVQKIVKGSRLRPFIDDVFVKSNNVRGMVKLVELFFDFCFDHNLILSRKKALIMRKCLKTLGFVVSKEGKHLDPGRIISLLEAPLPRSKETLHSMLSSYTFVRMFIPNFALIAAPLYEATKGIVWKGPQSGKAQGIKIIDPNFEYILPSLIARCASSRASNAFGQSEAQSCRREM